MDKETRANICRVMANALAVNYPNWDVLFYTAINKKAYFILKNSKKTLSTITDFKEFDEVLAVQEIELSPIEEEFDIKDETVEEIFSRSFPYKEFNPKKQKVFMDGIKFKYGEIISLYVEYALLMEMLKADAN